MLPNAMWTFLAPSVAKSYMYQNILLILTTVYKK